MFDIVGIEDSLRMFFFFATSHALINAYNLDGSIVSIVFPRLSLYVPHCSELIVLMKVRLIHPLDHFSPDSRRSLICSKWELVNMVWHWFIFLLKQYWQLQFKDTKKDIAALAVFFGECFPNVVGHLAVNNFGICCSVVSKGLYDESICQCMTMVPIPNMFLCIWPCRYRVTVQGRSVGESNESIKYRWKNVRAGWIWLIAINDAVKTMLDEEDPGHVRPSVIISWFKSWKVNFGKRELADQGIRFKESQVIISDCLCSLRSSCISHGLSVKRCSGSHCY